MRGVGPAAVVDVSPEGQAVAAGSADEPTDAEAFVEAEAAARLGDLAVDTDGEIGLRVRKQNGGRLLPAYSRAGSGFLFRSTWPEEVPLGRLVRLGDGILVEWRNRSGGEVAVEAFLTLRPVQGNTLGRLEDPR